MKNGLKLEAEQVSASRFYIRARAEHTALNFFLRTFAAQIHAYSAVASFIGLLILARITADYPLSNYLSVILFSVCCIILFSSSALMHFMVDGFDPSPMLSKVLENIDKMSIYLLIASTYTAVMHPILEQNAQLLILGTVWSLAIIGCLYTVFIHRLPRWAQSRIVYTGQFILIGWTALLCIKDIVAAISFMQSCLIFDGGLTYSIGAVGYATEWPTIGKNFGYHELWHLSVSLGCLFFYILVVSLYL